MGCIYFFKQNAHSDKNSHVYTELLENLGHFVFQEYSCLKCFYLSKAGWSNLVAERHPIKNFVFAVWFLPSGHMVGRTYSKFLEIKKKIKNLINL